MQTEQRSNRGATFLTNHRLMILRECPGCDKIIDLMIMYQGFVWVSDCRDLDEMIEQYALMDIDDMESDIRVNIKRLARAQEWLGEYIDKPEMYFTNRKRYFNACSKIVKYFDDFELELPFQQEYSPPIMTTYRILLGREDVYPRLRDINKICVCIRLLHQMYGADLNDLYSQIFLEPVFVAVKDAMVYHNIILLLKEYARIMYSPSAMRDKAVQILGETKKNDFFKVNISDQKCYEAYAVAQYIKIITAALSKLKTMPSSFDYYKLIVAIIDGYRKGNYATNRIAEALGISRQTYYVRREEAFIILGGILWGYDSGFLRIVNKGPRSYQNLSF